MHGRSNFLTIMHSPEEDGQGQKVLIINLHPRTLIEFQSSTHPLVSPIHELASNTGRNTHIN